VFQTNGSCFITLNKAAGISSASALNRLKNLLKVKKAGFCGTLDPLAKGVIVVATGKATKLISLVTDSDKVYSGKMVLGYESASFDKDTELVPTGVEFDLSKIDLREIEKKFTGYVKQTPPAYSAVKIDGVRAYKLARQGECPEIKERTVFMNRISLSVSSDTEISFSIECSKGTYIRSLVNDIGKELGCGAVMAELLRERVGDFDLAHSVTIDEMKNDISSVERGVTEIDAFLKRFKTMDVDRTSYDWLRNGKDIAALRLELSEGLNYIRFDNEPAFVLKSEGDSFSYFAYLRD
jgi:tRNA pseudouridine55 synthase